MRNKQAQPAEEAAAFRAGRAGSGERIVSVETWENNQREREQTGRMALAGKANISQLVSEVEISCG